ncbi:hypothetical protein ACJX0J_033463, partial [Zea mays]
YILRFPQSVSPNLVTMSLVTGDVETAFFIGFALGYLRDNFLLDDDMVTEEDDMFPAMYGVFWEPDGKYKPILQRTYPTIITFTSDFIFVFYIYIYDLYICCEQFDINLQGIVFSRHTDLIVIFLHKHIYMDIFFHKYMHNIAV